MKKSARVSEKLVSLGLPGLQVAARLVALLNKYIDHYQLPLVRNKNKPEKLRATIKHLIEQRNNEDESDDDVVLNEIGESSDAFSDSSSVAYQTLHRQTRRTTR